MWSSYTEMLMGISGIDSFDENVGMTCGELRHRC